MNRLSLEISTTARRSRRCRRERRPHAGVSRAAGVTLADENDTNFHNGTDITRE